MNGEREAMRTCCYEQREEGGEDSGGSHYLLTACGCNCCGRKFQGFEREREVFVLGYFCEHKN